ncbi:MAG: HAMP domain-containing sensor histidine kinase [Acidobacteriota bacterium]|nr:HAMP domain-containing sensor histidine kinase [Acidobacteriota bacterium]
MYPNQRFSGGSCGEVSAEALRNAAAAERQVVEILTRTAHELNTPLAIVAGYADVLARETEGALNTRQQLILNNLQRGITRLKKVVQDLLACGASDDAPSMHLQDGDLTSCLEEICSFWQERYEENGVMLNTRLKRPFRTFPFDSLRVQRAISNLLDNALRFSPKGSTVEVAQEPIFWERRHRAAAESERRKQERREQEWREQERRRRERRNQEDRASNAVRVVVSDKGPGVPSELQQEIFKEFVRHDSSGSGMGLGLAIARRVVEAHGGRIWVESVDGAPTSFCFVLPFASPRGGQARPETQA